MRTETYTCIKDYPMEDGDLAFIKGDKYYFYIDDDEIHPYKTNSNALRYLKHSLSYIDMIEHFKFPIKFGR